MNASVRIYRALIRLYPRSFRQQYGDDMVFLFEEMCADRTVFSVWRTTLRDAATSIVIQRMEPLMSEISSRTLTTGFFALLMVFVALAVRGTPGTAFGLLFVVLLLTGLMATLVLRSRAPYVEPATQIHRHWWRYLAAAAACFGAGYVGSGVLKLDAWMLLFIDIIAGMCLAVIGVLLGLWHGAYRLRLADSS